MFFCALLSCSCLRGFGWSSGSQLEAREPTEALAQFMIAVPNYERTLDNVGEWYRVTERDVAMVRPLPCIQGVLGLSLSRNTGCLTDVVRLLFWTCGHNFWDNDRFLTNPFSSPFICYPDILRYIRKMVHKIIILVDIYRRFGGTCCLLFKGGCPEIGG
jgi:hypothetical protein